MAELKKNAIKKAIRSIEKSYDYHSYNGKYDVLVDLDELVDLIANMSMPTTTESEIRAKAIDEFAEKIRDWQKEVYQNDRYAGELDFLFKHIYEIAEQLKGD